MSLLLIGCLATLLLSPDGVFCPTVVDSTCGRMLQTRFQVPLFRVRLAGRH